MLRSYELSLPKILRVMRLSELKDSEKIKKLIDKQ